MRCQLGVGGRNVLQTGLDRTSHVKASSLGYRTGPARSSAESECSAQLPCEEILLFAQASSLVGLAQGLRVLDGLGEFGKPYPIGPTRLVIQEFAGVSRRGGTGGRFIARRPHSLQVQRCIRASR